MTIREQTFGERLRELRKKAGWTQMELAERADVHNVSIAKWETGAHNPSAKSEAKVLAVFGLKSERPEKPQRGGRAGGGKTMKFTLYGEPPSMNKLERMHWAVKKKLRARYGYGLMAGIRELDPKPAPGSYDPPRMVAVFTVYRNRMLDEDNAYGGLKPMIDALRDVKLIRNDSTRWFRMVVHQVRLPYPEQWRTEIELYPDDAIEAPDRRRGARVGTPRRESSAERGAAAHVGGWIVEVVLGDADKLTSRVKAEFISFHEPQL